MWRTWSGMGLASFHRTTLAYCWPADLEEAPSAWMEKYGWVARSSMKLWAGLARKHGGSTGGGKDGWRGKDLPLADSAGCAEDADLDLGAGGHGGGRGEDDENKNKRGVNFNDIYLFIYLFPRDSVFCSPPPRPQ